MFSMYTTVVRSQNCDEMIEKATVRPVLLSSTLKAEQRQGLLQSLCEAIVA
jgi:hypothetical protein